MDARDQKIRLFVYEHFLEFQRPPAVSEIAARFGLSRARVSASLNRLQAEHMLVLERSKSEIRMAMPFSAVETGIRVSITGKSWWANCAWDALGIPAMLHADARIEACCPDCSAEIDLQVKDAVLSGNAEILRFEVPVAHFWDDIIHT